MKPLLLLPGAIGVILSGLSYAQTTLHWRAEAANGNWNDANNWWNGSGTESPPGAEILSLGNNIQTVMTNDAANTTRHGIIFTSDVSTSRTIGGSTENAFVAVGGNAPFIRNNSGNNTAHTLNFPISVGLDGLILDTIGGALNLNGTISGSGLITKSGGVAGGGGAQNAVITGNNENFTGKWLVTGGNLSINADAALGAVPGSFVADAITLDGGSLANMSNANGTGFSAGHSFALHANRGITLGSGGGNIRIGYGQTVTINGAISGSGRLTHSDGGTLVLAGVNTYEGITHLNSNTGILRTDVDGALPTTGVLLGPATSSLNINGTTQTIGGLSSGLTSHTNATVNLGDNGSLTVTRNSMPGGSPANTGDNLYAGIFGTGTLTYHHTGTGENDHRAHWNLRNTNSDFTGDLVVSRGRLRIQEDSALGNAANRLVFDGEVVSSLASQGGSASLQVIDGSAAAGESGNLTLGASHTVVLNTGKEGTFYVWGSTTNTVHGQITGGGNLRKEDGGTLLLTNTANNYTGLTRLAAGPLQLGASGVIPDASSVEIAGGSLQLNGHNETVASLFGSGGEVIGGSILTVNTSGEANYAGRIRNNVTLHMAGTGTQTLSGTGDNDSGWASVSSGTLVLAKSGPDTSRAIGRGNGGVALTITGGTARLDGGHNDQIYGDSSVEMTGGVFDFNGRTESFRGLIGTGGVIHNSAVDTTATLTVGQIINAGAADYSYSGVIEDGAGTMALTKIGTGTQTLSGNNTYTGATTISAGTLLVTGQLGETDISIAEGASLGGNGEIAGFVSTAGAGSIISPGTSPGTLTLGSLDVSLGATFLFELGTVSDLLAISDSLTAGGPLDFQFSNSGGLAAATAYTLFTFDSQTGLNVADLEASVLPAGFALDPNFGDNGWQINGNSLQVQFIPEPSSALLAALGSLALAIRRRR